MGVVAIAVGTSGAKTDAVASSSSTNNNTNTVTNQAPTGVALTTALTGNAILETASTATRTKVADIAVTDDALGTNSITLSGADAASFEVVGNALYLKANVALRYSTQSQYNVTVNVADSTASSTAAVTSAYQLNITGVPTNLGGSFTAGPAISGNGLEVQVYRADTGALLTTTKVGNDGTYSFNVTYVGAVIVVIRGHSPRRQSHGSSESEPSDSRHIVRRRPGARCTRRCKSARRSGTWRTS
jgi:hypothetical protein